MNPKQQVAEDLISCRNILLGERTNEYVLPCLERVMGGLESITVPSTREILERCVAEAIERVEASDFLGAGLVLNFVHNLPLDEISEQRWSIDYFLSVELASFLDHFEEVKSVRALVLQACSRLNARYGEEDR